MGFWPFGGNKRQRSQDLREHVHEKSQHSSPSDTMAGLEKGVRPVSGTGAPDAKEGKTRRMSKTRASLSTLGTSGQQQARSFTAPVNSSRRESSSGKNFTDKDLYQHTPLSQSSLGPENFSVTPQPPTLYAKRSDYVSSVPRRKSSKRKAEDYAREREVRAMASSPIPIPKRPATFYGTGVMQRDTKEMPGDLNKKLKRPSSRVSLPVPETLPSVDDVSNQSSFKIGTFAALSPRPTIKYDSNPRSAPGKRAVREKPSIKQAIAEEPVDDSERINELADDLDAGGLRELMEKDRRRREKKKEADRAKLQRKLQRRAERQKEEEARKARTEDFVRQSSTSLEKVHNNELHSPTKSTDVTREEAGPSFAQGRGDADPFRDPETPNQQKPVEIRNPFEDEQEIEIMQDSPGYNEGPEPAIPMRSPLRDAPRRDKEAEDKPVPTSLSPPVSPVHRPSDGQSLSQASFLNREETPDAPGSAVLERKPSDQSSQRLSLWTNFFRRGTRRQPSSSFRGRDTPSEFSNTSRESFARKQQQPPQPPPVVVPRTYRRSDSALTPQRTTSKFREDLPELPISPPDSRLQSPETSDLPALSAVSQAERKDADSSLGEPGPAEPTIEPSSPEAGQTSRTGPKTPADLDVAAENTAASAPISQSLASVDSEGSWLSGKPIKRQSGQGSPSQLRKSQSSLRRHTPGTYDDDNEGVADDEFLNRLSPAPGDRRVSADTEGRKASSTIINLQDDGQATAPSEQPKAASRGDESYHLHAGVGRQPTVVRQAGRAKSKEGLMQDYSADAPQSSAPDTEVETENELDVESPGVELQEAQLMRARSVDYKGHARQISAGSAKLLDIRRASQLSESGSKGPLSPKWPKPENEAETAEPTKAPE